MATETQSIGSNDTHAAPSHAGVIALAWLAVGIPLLWGVYQTLLKAVSLFS